MRDVVREDGRSRQELERSKGSSGSGLIYNRQCQCHFYPFVLTLFCIDSLVYTRSSQRLHAGCF